MTNETIKTVVMASLLYGVLEPEKYTELLADLVDKPKELGASEIKSILSKYNVSLDECIAQGKEILKEC